ncbi:uncharacterized protein RHOBADRAFT_41081 [Rhodotorula graminis WP1]|uniref:Homeobox domain-containing protein n=1 Tax=Rhodotorula graminis (strain WP1) TaxID=578459 RepID=A0A194SFY4_RHOGW|nr:uncharacterized protein RHOBADRAFT_41081 [Rhodotorula graminis WP1]KPV78536.1 hypothetical protein RHOBADRAFT_41081 [Rhodotorula graminis WP1]
MWPQPGASRWTQPPHGVDARHVYMHDGASTYDPYGQQYHGHGEYGFAHEQAHRVDGGRVVGGPAQHSSPSSSASRPHAQHDHAYHPYRQSPAPTPTKAITFVDANEQIEAALKGSSLDALQNCRPKRKRILPDQLERLLEVFETTDSPTFEVRDKLGAATSMTNREVQVWFQNRRAKVNRQRLASLAVEEAARAATKPKGAAVESDTGRSSPGVQAAGQHQWRFRAATMLPPPVPSPSTSAHAHPPRPLSLPSPPPTSHHAVHGLVGHPYPYSPPDYTTYAVSPSPFHPSHPHPSTSAFAQAIGHPSSFGMISPPLSITTPSLASPGTASMLSYFPRTPSELSSPSGTFFRLALDSPSSQHPVSPYFSGASYQSPVSPTSPLVDEPEPRIHLPPIRSSGPWPSPRAAPPVRPTDRRSVSDSAPSAAPGQGEPATATAVAAAGERTALVRLPSLHGLLNHEAAPAVALPTHASLPTSPVDYFRTLPSAIANSPDPLALGAFPNARSPPSTFAKPRLVSRYSTLDIHTQPSRSRLSSRAPTPAASADAPVVVSDESAARRGSLHRTSLDTVSVEEERSIPSSVETQGIGLGMLVAAASEVRANDDEKVARLAAAKGMR